jgi:hypothetical protein
MLTSSYLFALIGFAVSVIPVSFFIYFMNQVEKP